MISIKSMFVFSFSQIYLSTRKNAKEIVLIKSRYIIFEFNYYNLVHFLTNQIKFEFENDSSTSNETYELINFEIDSWIWTLFRDYYIFYNASNSMWKTFYVFVNRKIKNNFLHCCSTNFVLSNWIIAIFNIFVHNSRINHFIVVKYMHFFLRIKINLSIVDKFIMTS